MTERLHFHFSLSCIGEGNGNPLQYSCLGNPRDGGAWWAAIHGVAQSWTQLKRLSSSSSKLFFKVIRNEFSLGMDDCSTSCATLLTHIIVWLLTKAVLVDVKWYLLVILICILHFLDGLLVKNPPSNAGDMDFTPRLGRSPGKENGSPFQYSCLEDPLDRKA